MGRVLPLLHVEPHDDESHRNGFANARAMLRSRPMQRGKPRASSHGDAFRCQGLLRRLRQQDTIHRQLCLFARETTDYQFAILSFVTS